MVEIKTRDNSCFPGMESWRGILNERKLKLQSYLPKIIQIVL